MRIVGVQDVKSRTLVVPLALETSSNTPPKDLTLVGGGRVWPWQNPWDNLRILLTVLDDLGQGRVMWFSPPDQDVPIQHPRLDIQPGQVALPIVQH